MQTDIKQPATVDEASHSRKLEAQGLLSSSVLLERRERKRQKDARYYRKNRAKVLAKMKEYRDKNRDAIKARWKAKAAANPEWVQNHNRKNYVRHRASFINRATRWIHSNRRKHNEYTRKTGTRYTAELNDIYIRHKLSRDTKVPMSIWPDSVVQLKRAELKLKRLWQNQKT